MIRKKHQKMFIVLLTPILLFLTLIVYLALSQDRMIFYPEKLPEEYDFPFSFPFDELVIEVEPGVRINAILARSKETRGLVFYNHGNAGNLDSWGCICTPFLRRGYDVLVYDYRGYGKSTGKIRNEKDLVQDALFVFGKVRASYRGKTLVFYGRSLGSGVAAAMADVYQPDALFLETPYSTFPKLVRGYYPFVPAFLVKYVLSTEKVIPGLRCPVFIIHGTADEVIPFQHSRDLAEQNPSIHFFQVEGGTHNDLEMAPEYQKMLDELNDLQPLN
jgi:pimeloyl-ACP methyl ester carboxylesterase